MFQRSMGKILSVVFSCCGGGLLHLLGTIPRAETRCFIRGRSGARHPFGPACLRRGHLHLRHPLLRQYHHQPHPLPHHVPQVSRGFQGELQWLFYNKNFCLFFKTKTFLSIAVVGTSNKPSLRYVDVCVQQICYLIANNRLPC